MNPRIKWIYQDFLLRKCHISHEDGEKIAIDSDGRLIHDWMYVEYGVLSLRDKIWFAISRFFLLDGYNK